MSTPWTFDDTMRVHDKAIADWLGQLLIDYGNIAGVTRNQFPILRIFTSPNQAFASIPDMLVSLGWINGSTADQMRTSAKENWPVLPIPFATIERSEPVMDPEQAGNVKEFRKKFLNPQTGKWEYHQWPRHMSTTYSVTFWSTKRYTEAFIREWVYGTLGPLGCWQNERLITVTHPAPWGPLLQRLKFEGSTDLSQLETEEQRFIRFEFQFALRTLVFVPITNRIDVSESAGGEVEFIPDGYGDTTDQTLPINASQSFDQRSSNLFFFGSIGTQIPIAWPVLGAAKVFQGDKSPGGKGMALEIKVNSTSDAVPLTETINRLDSDNKVIVGMSFKYMSTGAVVDLRVSSHDTTADVVKESFRRHLPLSPTSWAPVHMFALTNKNTSIVDLVGTGSASDLFIGDIDIRQIYDQTRINVQSQNASGGNTTYQWAGLINQPYLVVGIVHLGSAGAITVTCQDDSSTPIYTQTQNIDPSINIGFVFLVQPVAGTLLVRAPTVLGVDSLYLQRYDGPYDGNSV